VAPVNSLSKTSEPPKPQPDGKPRTLYDGRGLLLYVRRADNGMVYRNWIFRYATPDGAIKTSVNGKTYRVSRNMGLGPADDISLEEARQMAADARRLLRAGKDPLDEKNASVGSAAAAKAPVLTFDKATAAYQRQHEKSWESPAHCHQWQASMDTYASPILGTLDVTAITTDDVLRVLMPLWEDQPVTARRVRSRIEAVLGYAGRADNNPARWRGHLQHRLPKRKARPVQCASLPYRDMPMLMAELAATEGVAAKALQFLMLTGGRTQTIVHIAKGRLEHAHWSEIDLEARTWTVPASRMKGRKALAIPLSAQSLAVLEQLTAIRIDAQMFPGLKRDSMKLLLAKLRSPGAATIHGMRGTFKSWADDTTDYDWAAVEMALGHEVGVLSTHGHARKACGVDGRLGAVLRRSRGQRNSRMRRR
jgi:integrase